MKVLFIYSGNNSNVSPFVEEQINSIPDIEKYYFPILGNGVIGYLKNVIPLSLYVAKIKPDIIHAHFGLAGALVGLIATHRIRVTTFHGSDINNPKNRILSKFAYLRSNHCIFVSELLRKKLNAEKKCSVIPCGVDFEVFGPKDKKKCRNDLSLRSDKRYVLFSSAFKNSVKNAKLAFEAIEVLRLKGFDVELLELKNRSRDEVCLLMNAADVCLMTSISEGSPQFIKEALACDRPVVSTDVGDVKAQIGDVEGCQLVGYEPVEVAKALSKSFEYETVLARDIIQHFDNREIGRKIKEIYLTLLEKNKAKD